jgi:8-oxo-dGTP pyrophosphatase MutT (NUDIX family)
MTQPEAEEATAIPTRNYHQHLRKVVSAGVLCYTVCPKTGDMYFLLGQERRYRALRSAQCWSDFGGAAKPKEDPFRTASRECLEETMLCVDFGEDGGPCSGRGEVLLSSRNTSSSSSLEDHLRNGDFALMIVTSYDCERDRLCIVKRIPWNPAVVRQFQKKRVQILSLYDSVKRFHAHKTPELRQQMIDKYTSLPWTMRNHPAIRVRTDANNKIEDIYVVLDYLEKQNLRFFSVPELQALCGSASSAPASAPASPGRYNSVSVFSSSSSSSSSYYSSSALQLRDSFIPSLRVLLGVLGGDLAPGPEVNEKKKYVSTTT